MKRHIELSNKLFIQNRKDFTAKMKPNSVAIFFSGDIYHKSADATHSFYQNPDLFYLTGIDQEETILVLFPDAPNDAWKETLFIRQTNDTIKVWEGHKYTQAEAQTISGIDNCIWTSNYESLIHIMLHHADNIYLALNEHDRAHFDGDYMALRAFHSLKEKHPLHNYLRSASVISELRKSKKQEEIDVMQKAANITNETFVKLLKEFKTFKHEHEIEAFITYQFNLNKATHAYNPIIASGANSCILHYNDNNQALKSGDILLMDFGCSYSNYASDLSRTIPVNGKFSDRQRMLYNATLDVFKETKNLMSTSISLLELNNQSKLLMQSKLIEIGLLNAQDVKNQDPLNPLYRKYFPHGVSHFLGLDVHDVGDHYVPIVNNAVMTNEPGIYIMDEGLGIRIENDIVVTSSGIIDLLASCPIEIEEIEDLMNS